MAEYIKKPIPTLGTERLVLRPLKMDDAPRIQAQFNNWNVVRFMSKAIPWPYPDDGAIQFLHHVLPRVESGDDYHWAILEREAQKHGLIGAIGLMPASDIDNRGFWLAQPYWGRGYMTEATAAVNDFAFNELKMTEMFLSNAEANTGSHRLKEKAGAEIVSMDDKEYVSGTLPGVVWRLTADTWAKNRARYLED